MKAILSCSDCAFSRTTNLRAQPRVVVLKMNIPNDTTSQRAVWSGFVQQQPKQTLARQQLTSDTVAGTNVSLLILCKLLQEGRRTARYLA
ncbi:hypothetical protein [Verminephrobacter aporrectodeae]|uniref:hypothetical protein n=1 Tax=Verminephrobacter aporrectodeae TaxID=1110389 RepID=UPI002238FF80|nr:hypothetical protein [Verminephrobacter aporrectodeae]